MTPADAYPFEALNLQHLYLHYRFSSLLFPVYEPILKHTKDLTIV